MKNAINYYYNLYPDNIYQTKKGYYFNIKNYRYILTKYEEDIKDIQKIYDMHIYLLNQNFYVHQIILNRQNQILTYINNEPYILMLTIYYQGKIELKDILYFQKPINNQILLNWGELWSQKNDYLEYQISMLGQNHPLIRESFSYYIGLGETAIALVNSLNKTKVNLVYSHKRINIDSTKEDLYNPLNIKIDYQVRDVAEYLKAKFFQGKDITKDLEYYFKKVKLSTYEYILLLARMIYPTYYFDLYEEIITNRKKDEEIKKIIAKTNDFENILKQIYWYYKSFIPIPKIDWFEIH